MTLMDDFNAVSQRSSVHIATELDLRADIVMTTVELIKNAMSNLPAAFSGDAERGFGYITILVKEAQAVNDDAAEALQFQNYLDHSPDWRENFARQTEITDLTSVSLSACVAHLIDYAQGGDQSDYFKASSRGGDVVQNVKDRHQLLVNRSDILVEMTNEKLQLCDRMAQLQLDILKEQPGLTSAKPDGKNVMDLYHDLCRTQVDNAARLRKTLADVTP